MNRLVLLLPLVGGLAAALPSQDLAAPLPAWAPSTLLESSVLPQDPPAAEEEKDEDGKWKSSVNLGAILTTGNIDRRAATLNAEATRKDENGRTMLKATWNYSEQKRITPPSTANNWVLDQRRTTGEVKQDWFITDDESTYWFVAAEGQNDFNQRIQLRFAATVGLGHEFIKNDTLEWSLEAGVGYFSEEARPSAGIPNQPKEEHATGRAGSELDWKINDDWEFLHSLRYYFSLEDQDDGYAISDARLRANFGESTFGQLQWIFQWDNTPSLNPAGGRLERVDHLLLLTVGWNF